MVVVDEMPEILVFEHAVMVERKCRSFDTGHGFFLASIGGTVRWL